MEEIPNGMAASGLLIHLALSEGELAVLVNGRCVADGTVLKDGDEVAVLRQAEGGALGKDDAG
jgi:sulfur carrier protein ThiS